jgi:hypothetical protein
LRWRGRAARRINVPLLAVSSAIGTCLVFGTSRFGWKRDCRSGALVCGHKKRKTWILRDVRLVLFWKACDEAAIAFALGAVDDATPFKLEKHIFAAEKAITMKFQKACRSFEF